MEGGTLWLIANFPKVQFTTTRGRVVQRSGLWICLRMRRAQIPLSSQAGFVYYLLVRGELVSCQLDFLSVLLNLKYFSFV